MAERKARVALVGPGIFNSDAGDEAAIVDGKKNRVQQRKVVLVKGRIDEYATIKRGALKFCQRVWL